LSVRVSRRVIFFVLFLFLFQCIPAELMAAMEPKVTTNAATQINQNSAVLDEIVNENGGETIGDSNKTNLWGNGEPLSVTAAVDCVVKLTSPGNGTTYKVGASIPVKATASGVKYVQIYYKNVNNASDWGQIGPTYTDQSTCTTSWLTEGKAPGQYRIKVQGVNVPNEPPLTEDEVIINLEKTDCLVKLTSPGNGTTYKVGASIPVKATASGVKYVQIYYKNVNNASDSGQIGPTYTDQSTCTTSWLTEGKAPGQYRIKVQGVNVPNEAPLTEDEVIINLEKSDCVVKLTSPGNGTTYKVGASIPVKATASGVKYVQIYYKNVNNASDWGQIGPTYTDQSTCTTSWLTEGKAPGQYRIKVQGVNVPNEAPLTEDEVIINLEKSDCVVKLTGPGNGTIYKVGDSIPVEANASGVKYVQIYYKNMANSSDWGQIGQTFIEQQQCVASWPTAGKVPGQYRVKVQGVNIPGETPVAVNEVIINLEVAELAVINTYPTSGAINVPVDSNIAVSFNNKLSYVDVNSTNNVKLTNEDGSSIPFDRGLGDGTVLTIVPRGDLAGNTLYTVVIPANFLKDVAGNSLPHYTFSFTTGATPIINPPKICDTEPESNANGVPVDKVITVTYNKNLLPGENIAKITVTNTSNGLNAAIGIPTVHDNKLIIQRKEGTWSESTRYSVNIPFGSVRDTSGNQNEGHEFSFVTTSLYDRNNLRIDAVFPSTIESVNKNGLITITGSGFIFVDDSQQIRQVGITATAVGLSKSYPFEIVKITRDKVLGKLSSTMIVDMGNTNSEICLTISNNVNEKVIKLIYKHIEDNIIKRAYDMANLEWTPKAELKSWRADESNYKKGIVFGANTLVRGIPYSQTYKFPVTNENKGGFIQIVNNQHKLSEKFYSNTFKQWAYGANRLMPLAGNDCSGFVSSAFGISRTNCTGLATSVLTDSIQWDEIQPGDAINKAGSHVMLYLGKNTSTNKLIVLEQTPPKVRKHEYSKDYFTKEGYKPIRLKINAGVRRGHSTDELSYLLSSEIQDDELSENEEEPPGDVELVNIFNLVGVDLGPENKELEITFDKTVYPCPEVKQFISYTRDGVNYVALSENDQLQIAGNKMTIIFTEPLIGNNNIVKIPAGILGDDNGVANTNDIYTNKIVANKTEPQLSKVESIKGQTILLWFDKNIFSNVTDLKSIVLFTTDDREFFNLGEFDTVDISQNCLIINLKGIVGGKLKLKILENALKDGSNNIINYEIVTENVTIGTELSYPLVTLEPGVYDSPVTIALTNPTIMNAIIYYTLDGTDPRTNGSIFTEPIILAQSATLKAVNQRDGQWGEVASYKYIVSNEQYQTWPPQENIAPDKVWTIRFSLPVDVNTLNNNSLSRTTSNIFVATDEAGINKINGISLFPVPGDASQTQVLVMPPSNGWQPGTTYYLFINKNVRSSAATGNKELGKGIRMRFNVDNTPNYGVMAAVTSVPYVNIGGQNQRAGDIVLTETRPGSIIPGRYMEFTLPPGVNFASLPAVTVTSGDIYLDTAGMALYDQNRILRIPVLSSSSIAPGRIIISNIQLNIDNTVPQGDIVLWISGTATGDVGQVPIATVPGT
jgi:hypothetical protein